MKESPANVEVSESCEALMRGAAQAFVAASVRAVQTCGRFAVALSGGSTPKSLYRLLASDSYAARVTWSRAHVFWTCRPLRLSDRVRGARAGWLMRQRRWI